MTRSVFYSFHYEQDNWRAAQVRNIGAIEGDRPATDNGWEAVRRRGDKAIERWISDQMHRRSCTVVLVGSGTANRKWINYEIMKSWNDGMGVVGINIHGLQDRHGRISRKGANPFDFIELPDSGIWKKTNVLGNNSGLHNRDGRTSQPGANPFASIAPFNPNIRKATNVLGNKGGLHNRGGRTFLLGASPLELSVLGRSRKRLSAVASCYDPQGRDSRERYDWITKHLSSVVREAIRIRKKLAHADIAVLG